MIGIYKITNLTNNKCYIGQSINITRRWGEEKRDAFQETSSAYGTALSSAIRKYGLNNFTFEVIEECNQEELNEKEKFWADFYDSYSPNGYNMAYCGGVGNITGCALTIEQVKEIIFLLKTTNLTQDEIGQRFGITGKNIQPINTGLHWHILPNEDYPIRDRYFRKKELQPIQTIYDTLPPAEEVLIKIATNGFESTCALLGCCRKTLKTHLSDAQLPTSKKEIVDYYNNLIGKTVKEKRQIQRGAVAQLDKETEEVLNIFENSYAAGRFLGDENKRKHINEVCAGKRKSAYGFKWKRVEENF